MDAAQWPQQVATLPKQMEEITSPTPSNNIPNNLTNSRVSSTPLQQQQQSLERRTRPLKDQTINCPRCNSTNTKFCYYNNYSLTQPRYFCKTCRRYWTQGGTLRSVPVGGGSRKNKRSSSSTPLTPPLSSTNTSLPPSHTKLIIPDLNPPTSLSHLLNTSSQNPNIKFLESHDLNLAFPIQGLFHHQFPKIEGNHNNLNNNIENHEQQQQQININSNNNNNSLCPTTTTTTTTTTSTQFSALDLLRTEMASRGNLNPFFPMSVSDPNTLYPAGYPNLHEFKPSMNFFSPPSEQNHNNNNNNNMVGPNDHNNNNNNNVGGGARLLFPFADMNKLATNNNTQQQQNDDHINDHDDQSKGNNDNDQQHHNNHHGYWGGMLDGGTW